MEIRDALKHFNIGRRGITVYIASLELGMATANEIAKKSRLYRTYFYDIARKLIAAGLLKQVKKNNKTFFVATDPKKLVDLQKQRLEEIKKIIPELKAVHNLRGGKPKVYYYEGREGIDEINNDTLRSGAEEAVAFTTPRFITTEQQKLSDDFIKRRKVIGMRVRVIGEESREMRNIKSKDKKELRQTRILPKDLFNSEVEISVYGNKVAIVNYKSEFGMITEDNDTANVIKQLFEFVWSSKRVKK